MSDSAKDTMSSKDKDGAEKRGRGRPRKHPQVKSSPKYQEESGSPTAKRPRGRPKGSKNKAAVNKAKRAAAAASAAAGGKRRGRPKKTEKEEQPSKSSEEEEEEEEEEQ